MAMSEWIRTEVELPPEGKILRMVDSEGHVEYQQRIGDRYWTPDYTMYKPSPPKAWECFSPDLDMIADAAQKAAAAFNAESNPYRYQRAIETMVRLGHIPQALVNAALRAVDAANDIAGGMLDSDDFESTRAAISAPKSKENGNV